MNKIIKPTMMRDYRNIEIPVGAEVQVINVLDDGETVVRYNGFNGIIPSENVYGVNSEFDADKHKLVFHNYFEVVIEPDGHIRYAVPSHQLCGIKIACERDNCTEKEIYDKIPREYYADVLGWLNKEYNLIFVWSSFVIGEANETQKEVLKCLNEKGLRK